MTLAEDKRPEATLLIGLSKYASQRHTSLIITRYACHNLRWQSIGRSPIKSLTQCQTSLSKVRQLIATSY